MTEMTSPNLDAWDKDASDRSIPEAVYFADTLRMRGTDPMKAYPYEPEKRERYAAWLVEQRTANGREPSAS